MTAKRTLRILFVENHTRFARIVTQHFLIGYDVDFATSLQEAREALACHCFDIVLLDYDLEDGKGAELAEELSTCAKRPVVVAISAHQPGNEAMLNAGADAVCSKMDFAGIGQILETITKKC